MSFKGNWSVWEDLQEHQTVHKRSFQIHLQYHVRRKNMRIFYLYILEIKFKCYKDLEYIPWQISVRPNSPHVSSMNGSKRQGSKISNKSDGNQTSFKNNNSKRNVRIRVISSNTSESRPSWYKSMKMRRLSTATGSTRIEPKSNLGNRLLRYFRVFFLNFLERVIQITRLLHAY